MQTSEMCQNMATLRNKLFYQYGIPAYYHTNENCISIHRKPPKELFVGIDAMDENMYSVCISNPAQLATILSNGIDNTIALIAMFFSSHR